MKKAFEVLPPMMPNFVFFKKEAAQKVAGIKDEGFPIKQFTKQEAEEFGELMKQTFIEHWKKRQA